MFSVLVVLVHLHDTTRGNICQDIFKKICHKGVTPVSLYVMFRLCYTALVKNQRPRTAEAFKEAEVIEMIFDVIKICALVLSHGVCALAFYLAGERKAGGGKALTDSVGDKEGWESILNYNHRRGGDTE